MRSNLRHRPTVTPVDRCHDCAAEVDHCHGTLVLHADGSAACDEAAHCEAREDLHEWWIPCTELRCGCTGDEDPGDLLLLAA
jgi:hypothetical protein